VSFFFPQPLVFVKDERDWCQYLRIMEHLHRSERFEIDLHPLAMHRIITFRMLFSQATGMMLSRLQQESTFLFQYLNSVSFAEDPESVILYIADMGFMVTPEGRLFCVVPEEESVRLARSDREQDFVEIDNLEEFFFMKYPFQNRVSYLYLRSLRDLKNKLITNEECAAVIESLMPIAMTQIYNVDITTIFRDGKLDYRLIMHYVMKKERVKFVKPDD